MAFLLHQLITESARRSADAPALLFKQEQLTYAALRDRVARVASGLRGLGVQRDERVAVYLPKQFETVTAMFGSMAAGGVFVPVNPILKPEQVGHILRDCATRVLITSVDRAALLADTLRECPDLGYLILTGDADDTPALDDGLVVQPWDYMLGEPQFPASARIDADIAAILYTSGSTGRPKGVVLSHHNMFAGAQSVATYLENTAADRLLAVLPFSFDYGLSQLTTAFYVGASVVLMDYLLPRDVIRAVARYGVTGLAAVPPLWNQLAGLDWPDEAVASLRYITNSGGAMPVATTQGLRAALPNTSVYLMYGLTEAFRSTYLPPDQVDARPESMGRAIPNAEILVVRPDGSECDVDEPGELVHRGALVALGYWNDREKTDIRFKPAPGQPDGLPNPELAVWSGDRVRRDAAGYLYFIGRDDEMIKTSGYRVSPGEVEEVVFQIDDVEQAVAFGAPHPQIGSGIVLVAQCQAERVSADDIAAHCRLHLPLYMLPGHIHIAEQLPRNPNGKIDRKSLAGQFADVFSRESSD
ncbi:MAG: acyl-CoA ligase (AMP-forming), exosortase A system-associated [Gammaproteobacteria bacterium]|nr:acyl-CoA ligase (AMP-forming), exosortase A system-associated [Gammaproteobacteria bacterium]